MEKLNIETEIEQPEKPKEYDHALLNLWKKYRFPGLPPFKDSPVEQRLKETCERYLNYVINDKLVRTPGSDSRRRELHNQITLMTIGKQRSDVDIDTAEKIANFASELSTGASMAEISS